MVDGRRQDRHRGGRALTFALWAVFAAASLIAPSIVVGADPSHADYGKREFVNSCAGCHGLDGKGLGGVPTLLPGYLKVDPPDLTLLARNNGGVFPYERVVSVIDGRASVAIHGPRDMPVWGLRYQQQGGGGSDAAAVLLARGRILDLTEYIRSIQRK